MKSNIFRVDQNNFMHTYRHFVTKFAILKSEKNDVKKIKIAAAETTIEDDDIEKRVMNSSSNGRRPSN